MAEKGLGDVTDEEVVDGHVPGAPELAEVATVPPVLVELSVAESQDLSHEVEIVVENVYEADQPGKADWEGELYQLMSSRRRWPRRDASRLGKLLASSAAGSGRGTAA